MFDGISTIISQFEPISLAELNACASLQTRTDNKYFVPMSAFIDFTEQIIKTHVVLQIDRERSFIYDTQYFDTPDLDTYWTNIQGRRKRYKCRSRLYVDSGLCVFEIKLKGGRGETIKYKIPYREADFERITPQAEAFLQNCLSTAYNMKLTKILEPSVRTHYKRVTLMSHDTTERITCDFNLAFALNNECYGKMVSDHLMVETKSTLGRGGADQLFWRMGVRPTGGSKYCLGMSLVQPELRNNPFRQVRNAYFIQDVKEATAVQLVDHQGRHIMN